MNVSGMHNVVSFGRITLALTAEKALQGTDEYSQENAQERNEPNINYDEYVVKHIFTDAIDDDKTICLVQ